MRGGVPRLGALLPRATHRARGGSAPLRREPRRHERAADHRGRRAPGDVLRRLLGGERRARRAGAAGDRLLGIRPLRGARGMEGRPLARDGSVGGPALGVARGVPPQVHGRGARAPARRGVRPRRQAAQRRGRALAPRAGLPQGAGGRRRVGPAAHGARLRAALPDRGVRGPGAARGRGPLAARDGARRGSIAGADRVPGRAPAAPPGAPGAAARGDRRGLVRRARAAPARRLLHAPLSGRRRAEARVPRGRGGHLGIADRARARR